MFFTGCNQATPIATIEDVKENGGHYEFQFVLNRKDAGIGRFYIWNEYDDKYRFIHDAVYNNMGRLQNSVRMNIPKKLFIDELVDLHTDLPVNTNQTKRWYAALNISYDDFMAPSGTQTRFYFDHNPSNGIKMIWTGIGHFSPSDTIGWVRTRESMDVMSNILGYEMSIYKKTNFMNFISNMHETSVFNKTIDDGILSEIIINSGITNRFLANGKYADSWGQPITLTVMLNNEKAGVFMHSYGKNKTNDYGVVDDIVTYYELIQNQYFSPKSFDVKIIFNTIMQIED